MITVAPQSVVVGIFFNQLSLYKKMMIHILFNEMHKPTHV